MHMHINSKCKNAKSNPPFATPLNKGYFSYTHPSLTHTDWEHLQTFRDSTVLQEKSPAGKCNRVDASTWWTSKRPAPGRNSATVGRSATGRTGEVGPDSTRSANPSAKARCAAGTVCWKVMSRVVEFDGKQYFTLPILRQRTPRNQLQPK